MPDSRPMQLAVVGHTNVGKTSLLRTLTRDPEFGAVSPGHSTTRHVERIRLSAGQQPLLDLFDTPGLEDAMALMAYLDQLTTGERALDGPARLERFLASSAAKQRFEQEAKVLRQLLASDAALYVIDVREPVLAKYRDELALLNLCGKPLLPVLNFTRDYSDNARTWRDALARLALHAVISFDTVSPPEAGEQSLFDSLALLRPDFRPALLALHDWQQQQAGTRHRHGLELIAELLVDVAAWRLSVAPEAADSGLQQLQEQIRQREQRCVEALLRLYNFRPADIAASGLPLDDGRWASDLFSSQALQDAGLQLGGGAAAGATLGFGFDVMTGGFSLGMGTLVGGLVGGTAQWGRKYGKRILDLARGHSELTVSDSILHILQSRQVQLLQALQRRGHAAFQPVQLSEDQRRNAPELPAPLQQARSQPSWSGMANSQASIDEDRQRCIRQLSLWLEQDTAS